MKISTKGRYALRMMLDTAQHQQDGFVTLRDIAERQDISKKYLEQIALLLTQSGMLKACRGHQGGYMLTRSPEEYTVNDILLITEGKMTPVACLEKETSHCSRCGECLTFPMWNGLNRVITEYLTGITLADLLERRISREL